MWAEAMVIYKSGKYSLKLSAELEEEIRRRQTEFLQEDADAGTILGFLESYRGDKVCSRQLFKEALGHEYDQPTRRDINNINDIMQQLLQDGRLKGWSRFNSPRRFGTPYGTQKGWARDPAVNEPSSTEEEFVIIEPEDKCPF